MHRCEMSKYRASKYCEAFPQRKLRKRLSSRKGVTLDRVLLLKGVENCRKTFRNSVFLTCFGLLFWSNLATYAAPGQRPVITSHPQSTNVSIGATAAFTVVATGDGLSYRWVFNGALVSGATNATYVILNVAQTNTGSYAAVVFNTHGYAISQSATLTLAQPSLPIITRQPQSQMVTRGATVTLSVAYSGNGPFYFQWRRNGVNIADATNETFTLNNVQTTDAGDYTVIVYTDAGAALSDVAAVRVSSDSLPFRDQFDLQFTIPVSSGAGRGSNTGATTETGEPAHAGKTGGQSVWIAWQPSVSGVATISLAGSSFDTLLAVYTGDVITGLTEVASDDDSGGYLASAVTFNARAGTHYKIAVDGLGGASGEFAFAWSLQATTEQAPQIVTQPLSQTAASGETVMFVVEATPTNASFQWMFNGKPMAGANANSFVLAAVDESQVGVYSVRVTHGTRVAQSIGASLQINFTGTSTQDALGSDKLADVIRIGRPLRLGQSASAAMQRFAMMAATPSLSHGYSGTHLFSTFGAISEPGEPTHCNVAGGASYWFSFVAEQTGDVRLDTEGSTFDTVLAVYTAIGPGFGNLQPVACDNNGGADGLDSKLTFTAQAGVTYLIAIDGVRGAQGTVLMHYSLLTHATLTPLGRTVEGNNRLRLSGQPGGTFEVQNSADCKTWARLLTTNVVTGVCDFIDRGSAAGDCSFYRAITLQP
jgi:hypothetical protein